MRILYVGQLTPGGTCLDRLGALRRLGHEVIGVDQSAFESQYKLVRSVQWRLRPLWLLQEFNREILRTAKRTPNMDVAWVDKGVWVFAETIEALRNQFRLRTVHFTPDPQLLYHRSRHFLNSIRLFDHVVTTKSFEVQLYLNAGAQHVLLSQQSYCPIRYERAQATERFDEDVGFIGHYETHYGKTVGVLAEHVPIGVWGDGWTRASLTSSVPNRVIRGRGVYSANYVNALASFRIGLGLLSKKIPEQHTTRSFEIPAAGSFLLAERTEEHLEFFKEGQEAEFFGSIDELIDKARFYLANNAARLRIARAGQRRCITSGYDTNSVMRRIVKEIESFPSCE